MEENVTVSLCQEAFRAWLRKKYHNNIDELNAQWWTSFWSHTFTSFDEIESPAPQGEMHLHALKAGLEAVCLRPAYQLYAQ